MREGNALCSSRGCGLLWSVSRSCIGFLTPVTCRVVCRGVCSEGDASVEVRRTGICISACHHNRMLLLFGKGGIAVFDSVSVEIIVGSGSRQIPQAGILLTRPELGVAELHSRKLWHTGARGSSINFQTI